MSVVNGEVIMSHSLVITDYQLHASWSKDSVMQGGSVDLTRMPMVIYLETEGTYMS
jgi:hypothetical protein